MRSPSPIRLEQPFDARSPSKLNLMFACTETLANIFNQLHRRLERGNSGRGYTEIGYVSNGTMPHNQRLTPP